MEAVQRRILAGEEAPDNYADLRLKANHLAEAERPFYQQRAKCEHLKQSDRCKKFFHDLVKRNNKRNTLIAITKSSGEHTTSLQEVAAEFAGHFEHLLGTAVPCTALDSGYATDGPVLTESQQQQLIAPITEEEIRKALFSIGNNRALLAGCIWSQLLQSRLDYSAHRCLRGTLGILLHW